MIKSILKFFASFENVCKSSKKSRQNRLYILSLAFGFSYFIIILQLYKIHSLPAKKSYANLIKGENIRAEILDRNGYVLATNVPTASLYANPQKIKSPVDMLKRLKQIIPEINETSLLKEFEKNKSFVWIKRDLTPSDRDQIISLGINGIYFENSIKRVYTQGNVTSHLLGFVDQDNNGLAGVEKYFDEYLSTQQEPISLSIDYRVQNIVSSELDKVINKFSAKGGVGIVADVKTGEVLSMVSKPDFSPMHVANNNRENFFNKATLGSYEIGSVVKAISFAIAFDSNVIKMNDVYKIDDLIVNRRKIKDYHKIKGWTTVPQIFMKSSNIGAGMIGLEVGKKNYIDYLQKLGLSEKLDIELPERAKPSIPKINKISDLSLVTMSYGYGYSITPMHFVQAMVPISNGGIFKPLTMLKTYSQDSLNNLESKQEFICSANKSKDNIDFDSDLKSGARKNFSNIHFAVKKTENTQILSANENCNQVLNRFNINKSKNRRVLQEETSENLLKLLRLTVEKGTGRKAAVKGYLVGGKTGTANKLGPKGYLNNSRYSSFVAVAPSIDPRFVVFVFLDDPKGIKETFGFATSGFTAAPVAGNIISKIGPLYGLEAFDENDKEIKNLLHVDYEINKDT